MSDTVPTKFYLKEILSTKFWLPNGKQAPWEPVGNDTGVLSTNAPNLIFHLDNAAAKHVGGIVSITEEQFNELKKNLTGAASPRPLERESVSANLGGKQGPTAMPASLFPQRPVATPSPTPVAAPVAPAVTAEPAPPQKVRTGRLKRPATVVPSALP
jgi:hypothetical protein